MTCGLNMNPQALALSTLDLSHNPISRKGARYLSQFLHHNHHLEKLYLNNCNLKNSGLTYLLMPLTDEFRCALHTLHVESNHIDYLWALRLDYKFAECFYLRSFNLANNKLEEKGTRFLCDYISENPHMGLEELNLAGNKVNREALR